MPSPTGTSYQTVTIAGAWRQKDVGSAKRCVRWTRGIYGGPGDIRSQAYSIVGSNDQTTWYLLDRVSNQHTNSLNRTVDSNYSQYSYRYYRWIEEQMESGAIYILSHWFGMFDENNAQLTTDGSYTYSPGAGDYGGNSSTTFVIDSANGSNGTFNWQQTSNYGSGTYSGPTSMTVYDPTMPLVAGPALGGLYIKVVLSASTGLGSYEFHTPDGNTVPNHIAIYGNNDGSNDVYLVKDQPNASNSVITTTNSTAFSTYYIVIGSLTSGSYANMSYIRFYNTSSGTITPSSASFSSGWDSMNNPAGGSFGTNPMWFFSNSSTYAYFNESSYYSGGTFNGSFNNNLTVQPGDGAAPPPPPPTTTNALGETASFDLGSAHQLGSYGYCAGSYPNFLEPNVWKLGGSNDNTTWYLVDSVSNGSSGSGDARSFTPAGPSSTSAFRYYRWILQALSSGPNCYMGGFFLKDTSGNVITASVIQNNIVSTYHGGGHANFAYWINRTTFGGGSEDVLPNYNTAYTGSNSTTLITDAPPSTPGAPTDLSASAGNHSVSISFSEGSNGGHAITNYKYSLDGGSTFTAFDPVQTTSPVSITGLTNGVSYTIKLKAVNSLGDGAASASITVTPSTIPDAPTDLSASYGGSGAVEISFTAGSDEGATILNYEYSIDGGSTFTAFDPVDTVGPVTITGLSNGVYYAIELRSVNENGSGAASSSVGYFAYGPASPPTDLTWVDTLNGTIRVDFTPGSDQGDAITNYEYSLDGGSTFTTFNPEQSTNYVVISGLNNRTHYSIVLRAINAAGVGSNSAALNMYYMCFLEGTKILCFNPETKEEEYRAIETLRKGSLVKTVADGYKAIDMIGTSKIYNPGNSVRSKNRLYKCPKENYPDLTEDLFITGCHSILVKDITAEERTELMDFQGKIYVTDKHYRLIAAVDKRAEPHASEGVFNIWHMALENENYYFNYGIYANGLLVETTSLRMMKELSGMDLVQ